MTNQELIDYYADLLILQYIGKPKAYAMIQALVTPFIMDQLPIAVQNAYNIDTAVGVQLEVLGKYAGVTRNVYTFTGAITLDDDDFRKLIKIAIVQNNSGSSLADIQNLLFQFFPGSILVFDYQDMRLDYFFDTTFGTDQLAEVFIKEGLLPKPMGVQLGSLVYSPNIRNLFGFRSYTLPGHNISGLNSYSDYHSDRPWLSYANGLST